MVNIYLYAKHNVSRNFHKLKHSDILEKGLIIFALLLRVKTRSENLDYVSGIRVKSFKGQKSRIRSFPTNHTTNRDIISPIIKSLILQADSIRECQFAYWGEKN